MVTTVVFLNLIVSLASAAWSAVALVRPGSLSKSIQATGGEAFYSRMYAARGIPIGLLSGILPFWFRGSPITWLLLCAAVIQLADAAIAIQMRERAMFLAASFGMAVHLWCAFVLAP